MRIAICDDDVNFTGELKGAIEAAYDVSNDPLTVSVFHDGASLLADGPECDALFLDIQMPGLNGFAVASRLIHREEIFLIFVSMHDELVYESLQFRPFRFLRKSQLTGELPEVMEALGKAVLMRSMGRKVCFRTRSETVFVDVHDIAYIEIYGHWLHVRVRKGENLECYGSLADLEKQLVPFDFVRTHKSFLVNCRYVHSTESRRIILDDGTEIPLSRYRVEAVSKRLQKVLFALQ